VLARRGDEGAVYTRARPNLAAIQEAIADPAAAAHRSISFI
jgi:hypothetical protein